MLSKKILVVLVAVSCNMCFSAAQAISFSYDNYSQVSPLKYAFSFNGKDWLRPADDSLHSRDYKTIDFTDSLPMSWQVEVASGKTLRCWDAFVEPKKEVKNIVTLSKAEFAKEENLLLDVIDEGENNIFVSIIDQDGESTYSNSIVCKVE
jgi:hypothetical protein